jgi:hypothetical protein
MPGINKLKKIVKNSYWLYRLYFALRYEIPCRVMGDKWMIKRSFRTSMGFSPNLDNPKTLNEKLQWLKLNDRDDFHTLAADKLRVRDYYKSTFGDEHIVPLIKHFNSWKDVTYDSLPDEPFVIKANTGTGTWMIVRDKRDLNIKKLRIKCRKWLNCNHYYGTQEWQYKNIKPCLIVEKLLTDSEGKIPVDYKLHYINGELQFIYCVVDREGDAYRAMFSPDWKLLPFQWVSVLNHKPLRSTVNEPKPKNLDKMIEYGNIIAKKFKYYVRVDYYEVGGKMYFGEITMHHGSGHNKFFPSNVEEVYADKLIIH